MSAISRQIIWSVSFALSLSLFLIASFLMAFPHLDLTDLWVEKVKGMAVGVFIPVISIGAGIIFGAVSGLYWSRQFAAVEQGLRAIEEGKYQQLKNPASFPDMKSIRLRTEKIADLLTEQAKLSQRLATEKVENMEERIQEIISQERNRLARELHDSVSQQLFAASMMMSAITETNEKRETGEAKQLGMVEQMIHQSQLEMRALLLHLRPAALKGKTLQEGIEELLIELSQKVTMNIHWKVEAFPLEKGLEDHLFRILQESVSNTLRHSKATKLDVLLIKRDDLAILRIADDGVGFLEDDSSKAGSYGMQNMRERALEVGGSLQVVSVKNQGTRLEVKVPMILDGGAVHD